MPPVNGEIRSTEPNNCVEILKDSYKTVLNIRNQAARARAGADEPFTQTSYGTNTLVRRAFESEGLHYEDIANWFSVLKKDTAYPRLEKKYAAGFPALMRWLKNVKLATYPAPLTRKGWQEMSIDERFRFLMAQENFLDLLKVEDAAKLFYDQNAPQILTYDDLLPSDEAPTGIAVCDDLGSWEIRSSCGESDFNRYVQLRDQVENYVEGHVGHQHYIHAWPKDQKTREKMAGQYIELIDAGTWYLLFRQAKRDPDYKRDEDEERKSLLTHKYLGVYTRDSLDRLYQAVLNNDPHAFNDKFRMLGARAFRADPNFADQGNGYIPSIEMRSGNKGLRRTFMEETVLSRLISGDYSGLKDYQENRFFDPSEPVSSLMRRWLTPGELKTIEEIEPLFEPFNYTSNRRGKNQIRNKLMSPLLPWEGRLDLSEKIDLLHEQQQIYAKGLARVAAKLLPKLQNKKLDRDELEDAKDAATEEIMVLWFEFAKNVRLDLDLEKYIAPVPRVLPDLNVVSGSAIDVNDVDLGIEFTFRFPKLDKPKKRDDAVDRLGSLAEAIAEENGVIRDVEKINTNRGSHGHGITVQYEILDESNKKWRVEWDGIQRTYVDGKPTRAWGGHAEVVTPKIGLEGGDGAVRRLFRAARSLQMYPKRTAGGAHINFDLAPVMALPPEVGTEKILNLISLFESEREAVMFLWTHPFRTKAAWPVSTDRAELAQAFSSFHGGWNDLGRMLYEKRYFNIFEGRKPKYVPLNLTSLMTPIVPDQYLEANIDIRNPTKTWEPSFAKVTGRGEMRLFDAPVDEYMAVLQIKYFRALMNRAYNSANRIALQPKYSDSDVQHWKENPADWKSAIDAHLTGLGLDAKEFEPLIWDAWHNQSHYVGKPRENVPYTKFLPPKQQP